MESTHALRQDHIILRKKLEFLESALQVAPESRFVLREMCFSLQRMLQDHMAREADLFQAASDQTFGQEPVHAIEHREPYSLLKTVNELLLSGMRASIPTVILWLSKVIESLRAQMAEQERETFPALDEAAAPREEQETMLTISSSMSVNEILQRYPQTEQLFEGLHVNRLQEGYKSVDEFAWYHGMDVSKFLEQLRQAATAFPRY